MPSSSHLQKKQSLMTPLFLLTISFLSSAIPGANSQPSFSPPDPSLNFQPSLVVVIGILVIMFSLTFILLLYAKCCHRGARFITVHGGYGDNPAVLTRSRSRFSGIDKTVVESLPFFRFSALKGAKHGLECAVCLSKFEEIEILRLLPKCKHAFHIDCIDRWLEKHSSCPLCRHRVSAEDPAMFAQSTSFRFLWSQSERVGEDSNIELYVQREEDRPGGSGRSSSRFSFRKTEGSNKCYATGTTSGTSSRFSFRKTDNQTGIGQSECYAAGATSDQNFDTEILIKEKENSDDHDQKTLHKFNHKIIFPDFAFKNRWSNVSSSDLMFLSSEMLNETSSNRFSASDLQFPAIENEQMVKIKEEMEKKRSLEMKINGTSPRNVASSSSQNQIEKRSMSEITAISRFREWRDRTGDSVSVLSGGNVEEDRIRRAWLPIARRTVQWFVNRQKPLQFQDTLKHNLDV